NGARRALELHITEAIKDLHWKDFETLVDLVFRQAGWLRVSVLGQHAKAYDLELREPITNDRYVVQVKSRARLADLEDAVANFSAEDFRRVYFVVHSPASDLGRAKNLPSHVEVIPPEVLARQAVDAGLVSWLEDKVR
ncbi:restriction endonuclease, partial [Thermodesulfobacteriota bacterium]